MVLKLYLCISFLFIYEIVSYIHSTSHLKPKFQLKVIQQQDESWELTFEQVKSNLFLSPNKENINKLCDKIDNITNKSSREYSILKLARQNLLERLLSNNRNEYIQVVTDNIHRIPRQDLPNRQDIPISASSPSSASASSSYLSNTEAIGTTISTATTSIDNSKGVITDDCQLQNVTYTESILDIFLLKIFRKFVQEEVKYTSPTKGMVIYYM